LSSPSLLAQTAVDPSGHWEGSIQAPNLNVKVVIDLAKNNKGALIGTFGNPAEDLKGLLLSNLAAEGRTVIFELKAGSGGGVFHGAVLADNISMSGNFISAEGGHSVPFSLTRTGDARIVPAPKSPLIGKELEGTWNGTLDFGDPHMRIVLTMANQPDGTSTGTIGSPDGSGLEIPVAITQKASNLTLDVAPVSASYAGVLNAAGTELAGTWIQKNSVLPLTLRRASQ
jgi:hypothetical protein